jgi:hypothetical protein
MAVAAKSLTLQPEERPPEVLVELAASPGLVFQSRAEAPIAQVAEASLRALAPERQLRLRGR